jgi:hypothetical protein
LNQHHDGGLRGHSAHRIQSGGIDLIIEPDPADRDAFGFTALAKFAKNFGGAIDQPLSECASLPSIWASTLWDRSELDVIRLARDDVFPHFVGDAGSPEPAPTWQTVHSAGMIGMTLEFREALMVTTQICLAAAIGRL